ncbi:MAG: serine hydrolase [Dehalococcoidia bacterium]
MNLLRIGCVAAFTLALCLVALSVACRSNPDPEVSVTAVATVSVASAAAEATTEGVSPAATTEAGTNVPGPAPADASSTPAPTPFARRAPVPTYPIRPIEELAPGVSSLIDDAGGPIAVAVLVPSEGVIYAGGETRPFALASAVKVPIMLAAIEHAASEGRRLTAEERALVSTMIRYSDNVAASALWRLLGRAEGVSASIERLGSFDIAWDDGTEWGDTAASAPELARLLEPLLDVDPAQDGDYGLALALMEDVAFDQRWGVSAGLDLSSDDIRLALKDGWYPETSGWRVTSTGVVLSSKAAPYVIVVLTDEQKTLQAGASDLERIASEVHHAMLPSDLVGELVLTRFDGSSGSPATVASSSTATPTGTETATATPPAALAFRQLAEAPGVLVPASGVLVSKASSGGTSTFWYEVPDADSRSLLDEYSAQMAAQGWAAAPSGSGRLLQSGGGFVLANAHAYGSASLLNIVVGPTAASVLASTSP